MIQPHEGVIALSESPTVLASGNQHHRRLHHTGEPSRGDPKSQGGPKSKRVDSVILKISSLPWPRATVGSLSLLRARGPSHSFPISRASVQRRGHVPPKTRQYSRTGALPKLRQRNLEASTPRHFRTAMTRSFHRETNLRKAQRTLPSNSKYYIELDDNYPSLLRAIA